MKTVKIRDLKTGQTTEIPEQELAPGMMKMRIEGEDGEVFVDASQAKLNDVGKPLPPGYREIALTVLPLLRPYWTMSEADWITGFERDAHPVQELLLWMNTARVYHEMTHGGTDAPEVKKDVWSLCVNAMTNGKQALQTTQVNRISAARARSVVDRMTENDIDGFLEFWADRVDAEKLSEMMDAEKPR